MAGRAELARFQAEAEAVAAIDHPNIVKIFEVGALDGKPYFSLEFVSGGSLDGRVGETPQDAAQSARLVAQVARGMAYAHRRGIVHRDLKPANILLALPEGADPARVPLGDCLPKVSDFGLVKKIDDDSSRTRDGAIMGTPSYMAPEQAMGLNKEVGPAADIHALGGILYDLLTGSPPFRGSTVMETIQQVIHREPPSPRMVLESVPRDLATICMKCLEKNPQKRYATADLLADDLDRYLRGEPVLARPAPWTERVAKWARRKPAQAALAAQRTGDPVFVFETEDAPFHRMHATAPGAVSQAGALCAQQRVEVRARQPGKRGERVALRRHPAAQHVRRVRADETPGAGHGTVGRWRFPG